MKNTSSKNKWTNLFFNPDGPELPETRDFDFKFQVFPDCKAKNKPIRSFGFWENLQPANLLTV